MESFVLWKSYSGWSSKVSITEWYLKIKNLLKSYVSKKFCFPNGKFCYLKILLWMIFKSINNRINILKWKIFFFGNLSPEFQEQNDYLKTENHVRF